eukprot:m.6353 g.6353  ORF g.6353 m.6353 type:complete len:522 (-) comp5146_c0_seq2:451-2016(-)
MGGGLHLSQPGFESVYHLLLGFGVQPLRFLATTPTHRYQYQHRHHPHLLSCRSSLLGQTTIRHRQQTSSMSQSQSQSHATVVTQQRPEQHQRLECLVRDYRLRQQWLPAVDNPEDHLVVVSHNMLAHCFSGGDSKAERERKYSHLRSAHFLSWEYRFELLKRDLLGYEADVICLQECDFDRFEAHLLPFMTRNGYAGVIGGAKNMERQRYSNAIFFRKERMNMEAAIHRSRSVAAVFSLSRGASTPPALLGVASCHLEGDPKEVQKRMSQMRSTLHALQQHDLQYTIVAGDFNSGFEEPCLQWAIQHTQSCNPTQEAAASTKEESTCQSTQSLTTETQEHRHMLKSAYGSCFPPTYYAPGSGSCIDHCLHSTTLTPTVLMHPSGSRHEQIVQESLPNGSCPSDHLPIGAVFRINKQAKSSLLPPPAVAPESTEPAQAVVSDWLKLHATAPAPSRGKPTPEQLTALRTFTAAKKALLDPLSSAERVYLKRLLKQQLRAQQKEQIAQKEDQQQKQEQTAAASS